MSDPDTAIPSMWESTAIPALFPFGALAGQRSVPRLHKCNLCGVVYNDPEEYDAHLNTHFRYRCPHCDYVSKTEGRLKKHVTDLHESPANASDSLSGGRNSDSDRGSQANQPRRQSNRDKPRSCKCKQCNLVFNSREEFWEHSRQHIRDGKGLACPQCTFITEYKHHLEYHLRNHYGSKPFKCEKCNYTCVNKSMLNSHLKSHSNVYQYRCDDCTYATKYCHSLKLHLRKYGHKPAVVLNPDGTPNPLPIVDVYGNRRGPRPKKAPPAPPQQQATPRQPQAALSPTIEPELPFPRANWLMTNLPLLPWGFSGEFQRALLAQIDRSREQQSQMEAEDTVTNDDELNIREGVGELTIKEEPDDWRIDGPLDLSRSSPHSPASTSGTPAPAAPMTSASPSGRNGHAGEAESHHCEYCETYFVDYGMYEIHMDFHGRDDPFKCHHCGQQTANRLDFFRHLAKNPHA